MQKIKQWAESQAGKDATIVIIVILVGFASFGLGRLSVAQKGSGLKVMYPPVISGGQIAPQPANVISAPKTEPVTTKTSSANSSSKKFFASNRGQKFYGIDCAAGKNIKMGNRIYFDSKAEAEKAGYELSSSCR